MAASKTVSKALKAATRRDLLAQGAWRYAVDVEEGLEAVASEELASIGAKVAPARGGFLVDLEGDHGRLLSLRTVGAAYRRLAFSVPRPKALLGSESFGRLVGAVREIVKEAGPFTGLRIAAAGAESNVFQRLAATLAEAVSLPVDQSVGDLMLRVTPAQEGGWEVLVRLTPRPLSTRPWRVCNLPGGVNATVAVAMNRLLGELAGERYLNLMCGSGTLLIERALSAPLAERLVGVDLSAKALSCARENWSAAVGGSGGEAQWYGPTVEWIEADIRGLDLGGGYTAITADAPWGDAVGEHANNRELHAELLACAARAAAPQARFALLSHEVRIARQTIADSQDWRLESSLRVSHGGHNPLLAVLTRLPRG